jgi:hypothetical protein
MSSARTLALEIDALLHPVRAFSHPMDVVRDTDLTLYEKRAILSSWASDACAEGDFPQLRQASGAATVKFDDIIDALRGLDSELNPEMSHYFDARGVTLTRGEDPIFPAPTVHHLQVVSNSCVPPVTPYLAVKATTCDQPCVMNAPNRLAIRPISSGTEGTYVRSSFSRISSFRQHWGEKIREIISWLKQHGARNAESVWPRLSPSPAAPISNA